MKVQIAAGIVVILLAACMDEGMDEGSNPAAIVHESGPRIAQCTAPAIAPSESAAKLAQAGIEVRRTSCGVVTGEEFPALCGARAGEIILHDIPAASLPGARALGFQSVNALVNRQHDRGWRRVACGGLDPFIEFALNPRSCASTRKRLVLITHPVRLDLQLILLDQLDTHCFDARYRRILFGESVDDVLCSHMDSFAGPVKSCPSAAYAGLFDAIIADLDKPDLGLGAGCDLVVMDL